MPTRASLEKRTPRQERIAKQFSKAMRHWRERAGMKQIDAARALGVRQEYMSRLETGYFIVPCCEERLLMIARLYEVSADEVFRLAGKLQQDIIDYLLAHPDRIRDLRLDVLASRRWRARVVPETMPDQQQ